MVTRQPFADKPIYEVKKENSHSNPKLLNTHTLLPLIGLPDSDEEDFGCPPRDRRKVEKGMEIEPEFEDQ